MYTPDTTEAVWEQLRTTRSDPPAATTGSQERRRTYVFALEQSEQLFRAAGQVGTATRPLLIFYGLSQAGRAIAAAASKVSNNDRWELKSHGIQTVSNSLCGSLHDVCLCTGKPGSDGSFVRLSEILDSPLWDKANAVSLNSLWDNLPENRLSPLNDEGESRRTPLYVEHRSLFEEPHPLVHVPVIDFPPWVVNSPQGYKALTDYIAAFPSEVRAHHSFVHSGTEDDPNPSFTPHDDGWGELDMNWLLPHGRAGELAERLAFLKRITRSYEGSLCFFPEIGTTGRSLHPLMGWWAVLYVLSMLARYQPAEWAAHINVDESRHAVPIESLLKRAIGIVPRLIAETIEQVR